MGSKILLLRVTSQKDVDELRKSTSLALPKLLTAGGAKLDIAIATSCRCELRASVKRWMLASREDPLITMDLCRYARWVTSRASADRQNSAERE